MDGAVNLGTYIGQSSQSLGNTQETQALQQDVGPSYFTFGNYAIQVVNTELLIEYQAIGSAAIWGHPSNSIWGTMIWTSSGSLSPYATLYDTTIEQSIPTVAKNALASWFAGNTVSYPTYIALGTGSTEFNESDTELETEYYRTTFGSYDNSTSYTETSVKVFTTIETGAQGQNISEIGTFNASVTGTLFSRYVLSDAVTFDNTNNYRVTIKTTSRNAGPSNSIATDVGLNSLRDWFATQLVTPPGYLAFSTSTTSLASTDTIIQSEFQRNAIGSKRVVNNVTLFETILTYNQGNGYSITKTGLFDTGSSGTLYLEQLFTSAIDKANTFQIDETDQVTFV